MARDCNTPVDYWTGLRLRELTAWIRAHNEWVKEQNAEIERHRKQRRR